jgi:hypothetical protein
MTLVFEKNANFFAEICRKLQKIVIITLTSNFRPLGNCFLWAVFFNCKSSPQIWVLFPRLRLGINFDKKIVGLHFGRIFHKLIWSHVPLPRYSPRRIILDSLWKERGTKMVNFQAPPPPPHPPPRAPPMLWFCKYFWHWWQYWWFRLKACVCMYSITYILNRAQLYVNVCIYTFMYMYITRFPPPTVLL